MSGAAIETMLPATTRRARRLLAAACAAAVLTPVAAAALAPIRAESREALFEIPKGTYARRRAGDDVEILPSEIRLVLGIKDVLVLRNLDDVPQIFGPTLIMPGQSFRLPFDSASEYQFICTAHASGEMTIIVEDEPRSPAARLRYRAAELARTVSKLWNEETT